MTERDKTASEQEAAQTSASDGQDKNEQDAELRMTNPDTYTEVNDKAPDLVTGEADQPLLENENDHKKSQKRVNKAGIKKPFRFKLNFTWLIMALLCFAVVISMGGGYSNYKKIRAVRQVNDAQRINHQSLSTEVDELRRHITKTESQNQQLLAQLNAGAQEREAIQQTLERLSEKLKEKGRGPLQWRLAEVEYLLNIANERLMLERDVNTAIKALKDADARLEVVSDPALIPVRQIIAGEITALKSVDLPDVASYAIKLDGLVKNIAKLPLINKEHIVNREGSEDGPVDDWRELPKAMWRDIKSLVTIRRTQEPVERLLPPDEIHYLYQNLGLKLEEARIALLQQNTKMFQQHLVDTKSWVQRYFAPESAAVVTIVSTLEEMETQDLQPPLPDISGSLRALREWIAGHSSSALNSVEETNQTHRLASNAKVVTQ